ncbi:MAG: DUF2130 domain-containing protein, partial [Sulfurovaceae bacterium]|nr:DUF2130 domain-containing protein [Sulfurovaceae bacterium]
MPTKTTIKCPSCQEEIDVNKILYHQLEDELKQKNLQEQKKLQKEVDKKAKDYQKALDELKVKEGSIQEQLDRFDEELKQATQKQLKIEKQKLQDELKREILSEQQASMELLEKELKEKSEQVKELNESKVEIAKLKREKEEIASIAKLEAQLALDEELKLEKAKIAKTLEEQNELKLKQKDEQLEQIKRELENARRKAEQGSMQTQGEALELAIESWLRSQFPFDNIDEVKKGAFGADCIQRVHTRDIQNCGVICYESKNTKAWSDSWIPKLKQDMISANADLGVLVTSVYPKSMKRMGFVNGIWVCSLDEFKGSSSLLRESLIRVHKTMQSQENRSDKMSLLYNYMTSNEFAMQMKAIVDGFIRMQEELDKEKRSLMASWKRR